MFRKIVFLFSVFFIVCSVKFCNKYSRFEKSEKMRQQSEKTNLPQYVNWLTFLSPLLGSRRMGGYLWYFGSSLGKLRRTLRWPFWFVLAEKKWWYIQSIISIDCIKKKNNSEPTIKRLGIIWHLLSSSYKVHPSRKGSSGGSIFNIIALLRSIQRFPVLISCFCSWRILWNRKKWIEKSDNG